MSSRDRDGRMAVSIAVRPRCSYDWRAMSATARIGRVIALLLVITRIGFFCCANWPSSVMPEDAFTATST